MLPPCTLSMLPREYVAGLLGNNNNNSINQSTLKKRLPQVSISEQLDVLHNWMLNLELMPCLRLPKTVQLDDGLHTIKRRPQCFAHTQDQ
jgi:hypothetical protein